jgi:hypothetical protein
MKKLLVLIPLLFLLSSATLLKNGEKITLASTADVEYIFSTNTDNVQGTCYIQIVSAATGVQVSSGEAIAAGHYAWPTGSKIPIKFTRNGSKNIHLKGAVSDIIVITY